MELWHHHYRKHYDDELVDHDGDGDLSIRSAASEGDTDADNDDIEMRRYTGSLGRRS